MQFRRHRVTVLNRGTLATPSACRAPRRGPRDR
ncbi:MAG: hypothetical protein ABJE66_00120 [Deltaproteobacteria bacterium]